MVLWPIWHGMLTRKISIERIFFRSFKNTKYSTHLSSFLCFVAGKSSNPMWISSSLLLKCQFANKAPKQNSTRIQGYLLYLLYMANQHQRLVHGWMGWQIRYICFLLCLAPNHTFDSMTQTTSCHLPCTQLGGKITKPRGLLGFSTNAMWLPFCDKKDVVFFRNKQDIIKCIQMWVYWILYMYVYIYIYLCIYNYTFLVLPGRHVPLLFAWNLPEGSGKNILQSCVLPSPSHAGVWP